MRVPLLGSKARKIALISLFCTFAISAGLVRPTHAAVFTIPQNQLLTNGEFGMLRWGTGNVGRTDVGGLSVDFAFTGLADDKFGIKDDYPVGTFYGQVAPNDFTG
ncbi:MAG TPA: hypothetical protein VMU02_12510, partial [bacterium]|nr:hypothetical protein [bacterium]